MRLRLAGRGMVDVTSPSLVLTTGVTTGGRATVINLPVPPLLDLSGLQLTFQSLIGPTRGGGDTLSFPSLLVISR